MTLYYPDKAALLEAMRQIAEAKVEHFFSDFTDYDVPAIKAAKPVNTFMWSVRDTGTYLIDVGHTENVSALFGNYTGPEVEWYIIQLTPRSYGDEPHCTITALTDADVDILRSNYRRRASERRSVRLRLSNIVNR